MAGCGEQGPASSPVPTGSLAIDVIGLPVDAAAHIEVSDPAGGITAVHGDTTLVGLAPGVYGVTAQPSIMGAFEYAAETTTQIVDVGPGLHPLVHIAYLGRAAHGQLEVQIEGLPDGTPAQVEVSGPDGFSRSVVATDTLRSLPAGTYVVLASAVEHGAGSYSPSPSREELTLSAGGLAGVFITYSEVDPAAVDLWVAGVELIQAIQRADGSVPLIRDRAALLRVYALASQPHSPAPPVRVEFIVQDDLVWSESIPASSSAMPTVLDRSSLLASWNLRVPAEVIQPGLQVRAIVDPGGQVVESDESNNRYPEDGSRHPVDVVTMGALPMRLVPVATTASELTGNVTVANAADFTSMSAEIFPFETLDAEVRATFTTDAPILQATNGNGGWYDVLRDVLNLRTADGGGAFYYYGVVQVDYSSGVAGMGFVSYNRTGGPNTAIGWDRSGTRSEVLAHELGHNLGRSHAPCGGPVDTDPSYPYPNARTGHWGYDARAHRLLDPSSVFDVMSYCRPQWISDYNYELILDFAALPAARWTSNEQNCVLVSGRIDAGELVLDPVVQLVTKPRVPLRRGDYEVRATDATGRELLAVSFDPESIGCTQSDAPLVFSWAIPVSGAVVEALHQVVLQGRGLRAARTASPALGRQTDEELFHLQRVSPGQARMAWDAQRYPLVLVRDADRSETVAVARRGEFSFATGAHRIELVLSDGVRSTTRIVTLH